MLPKIIVTGEDGFHKSLFHFVISRDLGDSIAEAGGLPLLATDYMHTEDYVALGDGLFLTGGKDIHAYRYGGVYRDAAKIPPTSTTRDDLEFFLCKKFMEAKKPVFGVGRGLAVINTVLGGTMIQDLEEEPGTVLHRGERESKEKFAILHHGITTTKGSLAQQLLGDGKTVNSCHHTAVKTLGKGLIASAHSEDGVVEAIEHETLPVFAVQWHPEKKTELYNGDTALFRRFIQCCKEVEK